ncbi:BppU family phage baseplate upper protein [Mammaliicoccus sciuri]|uniref:BppU family phage baseplate upper protein n=1 Tax=Mammaliicoccus sciuri TaxID=1296 RepID=UPI0028FC6AFE|nr:BppU family phage baseplate upper protein [Mammaliicoccus sciuri]MDU0266322.1 BppU family phage baseplate upper protein [Mammaliicoccus sciuri]MEB6121742.1 BppU family phage baseplate upper protein [Mammaliicoccus sciuri]MEB6312005.1 BppU family phage baseplate upper protein [Mammaliicoccus sciuri]MEB7839271.1 BppU family phage baseplate upper protein [Mammaliicoccus sciuri]
MYNKEGRIKLETTAHIQNRLDTNIQFYNTDVGTADLVFDVTRNGSPLLVSSENADVFLILKNGKNYIVDNVEPIDPMKGRMKYTIPNVFLGLTGNVNGQLFIAVHGKEDIVTEVEFSFKVADSLINTIPAVDKLNEIRTFQEFRESIMNTINEINEALANGQDYVSQMETEKASGLKALNDRSTQVMQEIATLVNTSKKDITDLKNNTMSELDNKANQIKADVEKLNKYDTSDWQKAKLIQDNGQLQIVSLADDLNKLHDLKTGFYYTTTTPITGIGATSTAGFLEVLERNGGILKRITFRPYNSTQIWQKRFYNTWEDWERVNPEDYKRKWLGTLGQEGNTYTDVLSLPGGKYECTIPSDAFSVNAPQDPNGGSYIAEIDVTESENGRKQLRLIASSRNNEYRATIHTNNVFSGWKRVQNAEEFETLNNDTGWIDWEIKNDATKRQTDDPNAIQCQYRVRMVNGIKIAHLRVNVNNLVTQTAFGSIPSHMVPRIEHFYARTPVTMNPAVVLVDVTGDLMFYVNETDKAKWLPGHYIVGEFSWIIDEVGGN